MNRRQPLVSIHLALAHAQFHLPQLFAWWPRVRTRDLDVLCWGQSWSSTACGHARVGGAAITEADVVVIQVSGRRQAAVYSNGQLLYAIERPNPLFDQHVAKRWLLPQDDGERAYESK